MKANELMIGDWVKHSITGQIGKVYRICGNEYIAFINGDSRSEFVEPIPLTVEILEKNGFNEPPFEMQKRERFVVLCKEYQINYYFNINWFSIYKNAGVNGSDYPVFICAFQERIKYIHELQHALRLCRIEKEIAL